MIDDQQLVQAAQADPKAFVHLYDRYAQRIYAYVRRECGDPDLTQDVVSATFEKALKNMPRYQWRGVSFGAWLYKIARNELLRQQRKASWTIPLLDRYLSAVNVEQIVHDSVRFSLVQTAMGQLSSRDQEVLRLHFFEELSHPEMAEVLGGSARNVAVRLHRAKERLRKQVEKQTVNEVIHVPE